MLVGMLNGCAKAGRSEGGGKVAGRLAGGNLRTEEGKEVILTEGADVVIMGYRSLG